MKRKDNTVETEIHPILTAFLFDVDELFTAFASELVITSGSESETRHMWKSLHYATPGQAVDIRLQGKLTDQLISCRNAFCTAHNVPNDWIDIVIKSDHIHIEYQPKRQH